MEQIRSLSQMIEEAKKLCASKGKKRVSVAMAEDAGLISAVEEARKAGLIEATLVGNAEKVKACIAEAGASEKDYTIIDERSEPKCGLVAVAEVSSKRADIYMKGQLHTDHFLRGMLNKEVGLRSGKVISHCYFHQIEGYDRILFISDAAFNTYPDLKQKADILQNTVNFARALGDFGGRRGSGGEADEDGEKLGFDVFHDGFPLVMDKMKFQTASGCLKRQSGSVARLAAPTGEHSQCAGCF